MIQKLSIFLAIATAVHAYELSREDQALKDRICANQLAECTNVCQLQTVKNDCDAGSMAWSCVCKNNRVPQETEVAFPVPYAQCIGSHQECVRDCAKLPGGATQDCTNRCDLTFKCDKLTNVNRNATNALPKIPDQKYKDFLAEDSGADAVTAAGVSGALAMALAAAFM